MPNSKQAIDEAIERALDFVHPNEESAVSAAACEGAIVNLGHEPAEFLGWGSLVEPARLFEASLSALLSQVEDDEQERAVRAERRMFMVDMKKCLKKLDEARLPLTVRNMRSAFLREGPFAREKK